MKKVTIGFLVPDNMKFDEYILHNFIKTFMPRWSFSCENTEPIGIDIGMVKDDKGNPLFIMLEENDV